MTAIATCECGRQLRIPPKSSATRFRCSSCGEILTRSEPRTINRTADTKVTRETATTRISFRCPKCKKILQTLRKAAGQRIVCPGCSTELKIPAKAAPKPANDISDLLDEAEQEAAKRCAELAVGTNAESGSSDTDSVQKSTPSARSRRLTRIAVGSGLSLVYYGLILSVGNPFFASIASASGNAKLLTASHWLQLAVLPMNLLGLVLCTAVPARFGKNYVFLAVLVEGFAVALTLNPLTIDIASTQVSGELISQVVFAISYYLVALLPDILSLTSYFLFLRFLIACCEAMKKPGLVSAAEQVWQRTVVLIFFPIVGFLFAVLFDFLLSPLGVILFVGVTLAWFVMSVIWLVGYLELLSFLKNDLLG